MDEEEMRLLALEQPQMSCGVCGLVLDSDIAPDGTVARIHPGYRPPGFVDHEPEPVEFSEHDLATHAHCDFCLGKPVTHLLPVRDFQVGATEERDRWSSENWAACGTCSVLLERDQWSALRRRVLNAMRDRGEPVDDVIETRLGALYRGVRDNTTGALRPI